MCWSHTRQVLKTHRKPDRHYGILLGKMLNIRYYMIINQSKNLFEFNKKAF